MVRGAEVGVGLLVAVIPVEFVALVMELVTLVVLVMLALVMFCVKEMWGPQPANPKNDQHDTITRTQTVAIENEKL